MDPITLGVVGGVALGGGILSYLNSSEARKASERETQALQSALDKIQNPYIDSTPLTPEEYKLVAKYAPEDAKLIQQERPELVKGDSADARTTRQNRLNILNKLMERSATGKDVEYDIQSQRALRNAAQQSNQQRQNIEMEMQRRGLSGSGLGIAARLQGLQGQAELASQSGEQAALAAEQRRRQAEMGAAGLSGEIYGEEMDREMMNADTINRFNDTMSNRAQQNEYYNVGNRNSAAEKEADQRNRIAMANTDQTNRYAMYNREAKNDGEQQRYNNEIGKFGRQVTMADRRRADAFGAAQDKNALIGGVVNAVGAGGMAYGNLQGRQQDQEFQSAENEKNRRAYGKPGYGR